MKKKNTKNKGIANADKTNFSGQFFCPDNLFCQANFFGWTIFLSGHFFVGTICLSQKNFCREFFLSGQKGIYHQVEFCRQLLAMGTDRTMIFPTSRLNRPQGLLSEQIALMKKKKKLSPPFQELEG